MTTESEVNRQVLLTAAEKSSWKTKKAGRLKHVGIGWVFGSADGGALTVKGKRN